MGFGSPEPRSGCRCSAEAVTFHSTGRCCSARATASCREGGDWLFPVGLSVGRRILLDGSALHLTPYVQPTVLFEDDTLVTLGLGLDLGIRGFPDVRLNGAVGDLDGFSVSLFWAG